MMFWEGLFSPSLKEFLRVFFKGAEDQIQQANLKNFKPINLKNLKLGLAQQIYRRPFTAI